MIWDGGGVGGVFGGVPGGVNNLPTVMDSLSKFTKKKERKKGRTCELVGRRADAETRRKVDVGPHSEI